MTLMGRIWFLLTLLISGAVGEFAMAQEAPRKKPVLVRREVATEPDAEPETVEPDLARAKQDLEVGDFYFRRGNYEAAAERYRDAVRYGPSLVTGYEKLVRALEKLENFEAAAQVCEDYVELYPDSKKADEFQKKAERFRSKRPS